MALDKLTKIDGGGISTTSDYRVGVITATKFVGPIEGSITATDASFSGNVSIAGTLTYEDVTNVDSVGILTARTNIILGDSIKHLGDENTLISFPANDTITAHTSGSERLRISSTGNVGIGTNNPGKLLEIFGTDPTIKLRDSSGDAYALIEGDFADQGSLRFRADPLGAGSGTHIRFDTDGTERLRITSDGKVGIGTANPSSFLSLFSDADGEELLFFDMGSAADRRGWKFEQKDTGTATQLNLKSVGNGKSFIVSDSSDNVALRVHTCSTGGIAHNGAFISLYPLVGIAQTLAHIGDTDTKLEFPAANTIKFDTAGSERLRITDTGLVGINVTPASGHLLHIKDSNADTKLKIESESGNDARLILDTSNGSGAGGHIDFQVDGTLKGGITYVSNASASDTHDIIFRNNANNERLRIASDGVITGRGELRLTEGTSGTSNGDEIGSLMYLHPATHNKNAKIVALHNGGSSGADLAFFTRTQADATNNDGGEERLRITSTGRIGINQSNPSTNLDVNGNIKLTAQLMQSMPADYWSQGNTFIELNGVGNLTHMGSYETCLTSNGYRDNNTQWKSYGINGNTGASQIRLNPAGYIIFGTEATKSDGSAHGVTERLRIKADGNIGINHTNPLVKLHITDGASPGDGITEILRLNASNNDTNDGNKLQFTRVNGASGSITCQKVSSNNTTDMIFGTRSYNTESESMRLTGFGKVGINSSIPQAYLDIEGDGVLAKFGSTDSSYEALYIKNNEAGYPAITNESSPDTIELRSAGSVQATLDYNNNDTDKYFRVTTNNQGGSGTELFRVQENGSVGIGTATIATNKKLDICDGIVSIQGTGSHDCRYEFVRSDTGSMGWIGIPNWNPDGFYIYVPTATSNEAGASYGDGAWNFFSNGVGPRLKILSSGNVQLTQNIRLESAPNSTWGAGLNIGGNGQATSSTHGSMVVTNGNLHLDARDGSYGVYLNWYGGANGTYFGNGSSGQRGRIDGAGNLTLSGSYPGSDLRLKENIQNISGATDTIKSLVGKTFTWKAEAGLDDWKHYGFIAQEVQTVVPDLVKPIGCHYFDEDDKLVTDIEATESDEDRKNKGITQSLTVNNEGVTPILVEAMKELIAKVETLEAKVSALEGT